MSHEYRQRKMGLVKCRKCGEMLSVEKFYKSHLYGNASRGDCKDCVKAAARKNRVDNIERYQEYERQRAMLPERVAMRKRYQQSEQGKQVLYRLMKRKRAREPEKYAARTAVGNALASGKLNKPSACEECGVEGARLEGHHEDYAKPLDVIWLCNACHRARHEKPSGEQDLPNETMRAA